MIPSNVFCTELLDRGYAFFSGVPCSFLSGPISFLSAVAGRYVPAVNEGAAVGLAAGARLAGVRSAVFMQNSGLGNAVNPLASLIRPYGIPVLAFVSLRGWPDPDKDEPQHAVMGQATEPILTACGLHTWLLGPAEDDLKHVMSRVDQAEAKHEAVCVLVPQGTIGRAQNAGPAHTADGWDSRQAIRVVARHFGEAMVFSTTGYVSRELFAVCDRPRNFYMQGSMGHALALGLGAATQRPDQRVIVLDGDGAVLMHMGGMCTVGALSPPNLTHIVLDNRSYESTGGQPSTSPILDWSLLARANGYQNAWVCRSEQETHTAMLRMAANPGPNLVVLHVSAANGPAPPRATSRLSPAELRMRFEEAFISGPSLQEVP